MQAAVKFCPGCGVDIDTLKSYEKRLLSSDASKKIKYAWEEIFSRMLLHLESTETVDAIASLTSEYICRRCFSGYERLLRVQQELLEKAEGVISKLQRGARGNVIGEKRKRTGTARGIAPPCKRPLFAPTEGTSPSVVVRVRITKLLHG